jgi:hypothetical protein
MLLGGSAHICGRAIQQALNIELPCEVRAR